MLTLPLAANPIAKLLATLLIVRKDTIVADRVPLAVQDELARFADSKALAMQSTLERFAELTPLAVQVSLARFADSRPLAVQTVLAITTRLLVVDMVPVFVG